MTLAAFVLAAALADSGAAVRPDSAAAVPIIIRPDSTAAPMRSAATMDSAAAAHADSTAAPRPFHRPHPAILSLSSFRLEWSNAVRIPFREPADPMEPVALSTIGQMIRLQPGVRTRELSQGPSPESFAFGGAGSSSSDLLFDGVSLVLPGTSGPHSEEAVMSELAGVDLLRGGAAALYGPQAAAGAAVVVPRFPHVGDLLIRAVGEEGSDEFQRASFQASRHLGTRAGFFATMESRRIDGLFPGTKEVDRQFAGRLAGALPFGLEGEASIRRYEGDERSGGVDELPVVPVETRASHYGAKLFHAWDGARGALLELRWLREKVENDDDLTPRTRHYSVPEAHATIDLPRVGPLESVVRGEISRWRIETEGSPSIDRFLRGGGALRSSATFGALRATGTIRADAEEERDEAFHARVEGEWTEAPLSFGATLSRAERIPARDAPFSNLNEVHQGTTLRAAWTKGPATLSLEGDWTRVDHYRPEPSFEEVRRRDPADAAPAGTGELRGVTFGLDTETFPIPKAAVVGDLTFHTSFALRDDVMEETGERLPRVPGRLWTGEGVLSNEFFRNSLHARLRGRLTYLGDRLDENGAAVIDAWVTDVVGEAEIGDALLHFRLHDLLERADEIEPGYRLPGFSWMFGVSWRFWG